MKNSNIVNGSMLGTFSKYELTNKFVEVPISVKVPPKIALYDNGKRIFVGLIWNFWHKFIASGIKIATAAVLFIKPDIIAAVIKNIVKFGLKNLVQEN